jgi:hypothetical protein
MLSQAVFEFGPLWLVALAAPAVLFGPYWAALTSTLGLGGYLAAKLDLTRMPVVVAQVVLALLAVVAIYAGRLLHDAVPSTIRAGGVARGRHRVLGAVPAVCPRARLGRPRAGRAADGPSRRRAGECGRRADADRALGAGGAAIASTSRITLATSSLET